MLRKILVSKRDEGAGEWRRLHNEDYMICTQQIFGDRVGTVVKVLCYKSEGHRFDPSWCHWNFSVTFRSHYGPGVDSASNRNEYQGHFLGVKTAGA